MLKKHSCFTPPNSYSTQRRALRNISIRGESSPRRIGKTDRKINPGSPAQRFMKPPLSRYIALAQRRTMALMSRRGPLLEKKDRADTALALRDQDAGGLDEIRIAIRVASIRTSMASIPT